MKYLDNAKVYRQRKLKTEPYVTEGSVLVSVLHITLGKKQRFFYSDEKSCQIYYWIGSLSAEPEFFHLHYKWSSNEPSSCVLDPNFAATTVERTILTMSEVTESNFTINIIDQRSFLKNEVYIARDKSPSSSYSSRSGSQNLAGDEVIALDSASYSSMTNGLTCPICNKRYPGNAIENHESHWAESNFFVVDDMNDEDTNNDISVIIFPKTKSNYIQESLVAEIKDLVSSSCHIGESAFQLRVWWNHVFKDFCEKMKIPWYKRQIGQNIYVEFYGEAAMDHGLPKREFFTGRYIIVEYFI